MRWRPSCFEIQSGRTKDKTNGNNISLRRSPQIQHTATSFGAPIEKVDIGGWLFTLPEAEYCRCCPPDHISCAAMTTDDGKKMSINVEMIGKTLMIQHYVAETATATLCEQLPVGHF